SIPSHGRLRDGLYRSLRRTGSSWNMPAPPAIRILKEATCSRGRSTARDETARRSQRQHLHGEPKSKLKTDTQRGQIPRVLPLFQRKDQCARLRVPLGSVGFPNLSSFVVTEMFPRAPRTCLWRITEFEPI